MNHETTLHHPRQRFPPLRPFPSSSCPQQSTLVSLNLGAGTFGFWGTTRVLGKNGVGSFIALRFLDWFPFLHSTPGLASVAVVSDCSESTR